MTDIHILIVQIIWSWRVAGEELWVVSQRLSATFISTSEMTQVRQGTGNDTGNKLFLCKTCLYLAGKGIRNTAIPVRTISVEDIIGYEY
jgi:hypothetical protein